MTYWTLPQTLLWILTGDQTQVDNLPPNKKDNMSLCLDEYIQDKESPSPLRNSDEAQSAIASLKSKALNGDITCYAQRNENSPHEAIPFHEWNSLIIKGKNKTRLSAGVTDRWQNIIVNKNDVLSNWHHNSNTQLPSNRGRTAGAGTYYDQSFLDHMHDLLNNNQAKSIRDAALQTVKQLDVQGASPEAKEKRLQKKYKDMFGR